MPDIVTSKTFVDGEKGITATKLNQIISGAVIQPSFVTAKPSSSTLDPTDQLLEVKGAGTYATITGQQLIDSVSASVTQNISPTIWSVRLRSFNSLGNPTFEVDQINIGTLVANPNAKVIDRWGYGTTGTLQVSFQQLSGPVVLPGTNFAITSKFIRITLTTQQASLGVSDATNLYQLIEGSRLRELISDVHSCSVLVRSSVSGLKFGVCFRDSPATKSLTKLCTIPSANTWTLISLANLPVWAAGGNWSLNPGAVGYTSTIALAAGTSLTSPANDTWQNGNFAGALGQDNFASKPVNSTFDLAFISHEPGSQCSNPPLDCPFQQNYDDCLRYFCKSYEYPTKNGTATYAGSVCSFNAITVNQMQGWAPFPKPMAKTPASILFYAPNTGALNQVYDAISGTAVTVNSIPYNNSAGINAIGSPGSLVSGHNYMVHYIADTGW
jgi:hypothetical protein